MLQTSFWTRHVRRTLALSSLLSPLPTWSLRSSESPMLFPLQPFEDVEKESHPIHANLGALVMLCRLLVVTLD